MSVLLEKGVLEAANIIAEVAIADRGLPFPCPRCQLSSHRVTYLIVEVSKPASAVTKSGIRLLEFELDDL
jgi:hypothetical protein